MHPCLIQVAWLTEVATKKEFTVVTLTVDDYFQFTLNDCSFKHT